MGTKHNTWKLNGCVLVSRCVDAQRFACPRSAAVSQIELFVFFIALTTARQCSRRPTLTDKAIKRSANEVDWKMIRLHRALVLAHGDTSALLSRERGETVTLCLEKKLESDITHKAETHGDTASTLCKLNCTKHARGQITYCVCVLLWVETSKLVIV